MDKMKLDDADNGFDNIGETEACKKLNELKQEPEEKSTVPQVFKKVYWKYFVIITSILVSNLRKNVDK